jgi:hypothetical protein
MPQVARTQQRRFGRTSWLLLVSPVPSAQASGGGKEEGSSGRLPTVSVAVGVATHDYDLRINQAVLMAPVSHRKSAPYPTPDTALGGAT